MGANNRNFMFSGCFLTWICTSRLRILVMNGCGFTLTIVRNFLMEIKIAPEKLSTSTLLILKLPLMFIQSWSKAWWVKRLALPNDCSLISIFLVQSAGLPCRLERYPSDSRSLSPNIYGQQHARRVELRTVEFRAVLVFPPNIKEIMSRVNVYIILSFFMLQVFFLLTSLIFSGIYI